MTALAAHAERDVPQMRPRDAPATSWLCDLDGVLLHDGQAVPGADRFLAWLRAEGRSFLVLTNNSMFTPRTLTRHLGDVGLEVDERQVWTSALAVAAFVAAQRPGGSAYVIGRAQPARGAR